VRRQTSLTKEVDTTTPMDTSEGPDLSDRVTKASKQQKLERLVKIERMERQRQSQPPDSAETRKLSRTNSSPESGLTMPRRKPSSGVSSPQARSVHHPTKSQYSSPLSPRQPQSPATQSSMPSPRLPSSPSSSALSRTSPPLLPHQAGSFALPASDTTGPTPPLESPLVPLPAQFANPEEVSRALPKLVPVCCPHCQKHFSFDLEMGARGVEAKVASGPPPDMDMMSDINVLGVEDDKMSRMILSKLLLRANYKGEDPLSN
jgi:hypothetical protein